MVNTITLTQTEIINHFLAQQVINLFKEEYKDATLLIVLYLMNQHILILLNVIYIGQKYMSY
jgi:hypothetical protein